MNTYTQQLHSLFVTALMAGIALLLVGFGAPQITQAQATSSTSSLTVIKEVINDDGGIATSSDFTIDITNTTTGSTTASFAGSATGTTVTLNASTTYEVSETANATSSYQGIFSGVCDASGLVILSSGQSATCTITNDDEPQPTATSTLTIIKEVINDDGGTATSSDFTISVVNQSSGSTTTSFAGSASGTDITVDQGVTYEISESGTTSSSYDTSFGGDCSSNGTITPSGTTTSCTITNDDSSPSQPSSSGGGGSGDLAEPRDSSDDDDDDKDSDDEASGEVRGRQDVSVSDDDLSDMLSEARVRLLNILGLLDTQETTYPGLPNTGDGSLIGNGGGSW